MTLATLLGFIAACEVNSLTSYDLTAQVYSGCASGDAALITRASHPAIYRGFVVARDGTLEAFDSFCEGAESTCTGARAYAFLPAPSDFAVTPQSGGSFQIDFGDKRTLVFRASDQAGSVNLAPVAGADVDNPPIAAPAPGSTPWQTGVRLSHGWDLLFDFGFAVGDDPRADPRGFARVVRSDGAECRLANAVVLQAPPSPLGLRPEAEIRAKLAESCGWPLPKP